MKIAIIGTGISGLTAAWRLHREHDLTIFEANDYIGGHTHTVDVEMQGQRYAVDTGFIVFNDWTYPNFIRLLEQLGVASQPTLMSFSVRCERTGLEYNGENLNTLFAQRRNLFRPSFHRMIRDILRFNREAPALLESRATVD
jgi:predicted NAD/FAD-binding protein